MADSADTRVNLAALKRVDPYAIEIVETGTQVAIYKFNSQLNEWVSNLRFFPSRCQAACAGLRRRSNGVPDINVK